MCSGAHPLSIVRDTPTQAPGQYSNHCISDLFMQPDSPSSRGATSSIFALCSLSPRSP